MRNTNWLVLTAATLSSVACTQESRLESLENKVRGIEMRLPDLEKSTHAWVLWQYYSNDLGQGAWKNAQWQVFQSAERLAQCEERVEQAVARLTKVLKEGKRPYAIVEGEHTVLGYGTPSPTKTRYVCLPDTVDPRR